MYGTSRLKKALNLFIIVFVEIWIIGIGYYLADHLGYLPPRAVLYDRLNEPIFNIVGHIWLLWQMIAMIAYNLFFVLIFKLLFNWPWFYRELKLKFQKPPTEHPTKIPVRYRVEILDSRPNDATRPADPTPPLPKPQPNPTVPPRQATPTPPTSAPLQQNKPKPRRKIPTTSAEWQAAYPSAKVKIGPKIEPPRVINLPVIDLGPPDELPKIYREKPRPPRPRVSKAPGDTKPKRLRKYQSADED